MDKKYQNYRVFLSLAIIVIFVTVLQLFLGFGFFASGSNNLIGYLVGSGGFVIFFLIYAILKKMD